MNKNNEKILKNIKYFLIFIILLILFLVLLNKSTNEVIDIYPYTDVEILNLPNHPQIFGDFQEAQILYSNVDKEKVKIYDLKKEKTTAYDEEEKYLLYIQNSSTNYKYIDKILLNFNVSNDYNNITLDEVIKIVVDYLPMEIFNQYYNKERSYIYERENVIAYHYSWKLNEKGIEYHNNGHTELLAKFGMSIRYHKDTNTYVAMLDIFADEISIAGYYDEEWYKKNTQQWNINLNDYIN